MTDKKKDNEYLWLQEQLTNDMNQFEKDKSEQVDDCSSNPIEAKEPNPEQVNKGSKNAAFIREMNELQQALASEVNEHTSKQKKTKAKESESLHSYDTVQVEIPSKITSSKKTNSSSEYHSNQTNQTKKKAKEQGKIPIWVGILIACVFVVIATGIIFCGKNIGKTALTTIGLLPEDGKEDVGVITPTSEVTVSITPTVTPEVVDSVEEEPGVVEEEVYHVLLIGLDNQEETSYADTIVIVSMNVTDETYHLTHIMRNLYVTIPGYGKEVISKAFHYGGGALLVETIEQNFGLELEGYLSTGFDSFIKIIDSMGGIRLELTADEANYLNSTNYISQKSNRVMVEGTQTANGDQTLGYCRIQEVGSLENLEKDFGRVMRAKKVIEQMFLKMGKLSFGDLVYTMDEFLPLIRTNLTKEKFRNLLEKLSEVGVTKVDALCIPIESLYSMEELNEQTVYVPEFEKTKTELHTAIYGEEEKAE